MISCGGYLHHIGMLAEDSQKTKKELEIIPGLGDWTSNSSTWYDRDMVVGRENTILCSTSRILDGTLLEVIQPVKGKCMHTHFQEHLDKYGPGLHHFCYGFPHYEDFLKVYDYFRDQGFGEVLHGRKLSEKEDVTDEYCYFEVFGDKVFIEINWTRYKWGY